MSTDCRNVLLALHDRELRGLLHAHLRHSGGRGFFVREAATYGGAVRLLRSHVFDCVLVSDALPDGGGISLVREHLETASQTPPAFIIVGQGNDGELATRAMRAGALDLLDRHQLTAGALHRAMDNAMEKMSLRVDLARKHHDLEERNRALANRSEEIRRFYQNVCHELRTPLAASRELVSIVHDELAGKVNAEQRELLGLALDGCDRISLLLDDMLDAARIQTGKLSINTVSCDISKLLRDAVGALEQGVNEQGVALRCDVEAGLRVEADPLRIRQVLDNLLSNAIKFTPQGGSIEASARRDPDQPKWVIISIADTGCGIPPEHQQFIFDRLYQVPPDATGAACATASSGLGLGLAICNEIIRLHDSRLEVQSTAGRGSTFSFLLPGRPSQTDTPPADRKETEK